MLYHSSMMRVRTVSGPALGQAWYETPKGESTMAALTAVGSIATIVGAVITVVWYAKETDRWEREDREIETLGARYRRRP